MKKIFLILLFSVLALSLFAQEIRPVLDDVGFCWKANQVNRLLDYLKKNETGKFDLPPLVAGISPHDDYLYAGRVYYPLFERIQAKEVVIFGVTHGTVRRSIGDPQEMVIFDEFKYWTGPYKNVEISPLREYLKGKLNKDHYMVSNHAHKLEHSIEAMIPFLQYFNRDVKITPIMITGMDFAKMEKRSDEMAGHIAEYIKTNNLKLGKDIFFLISADANHYGKDFNNTPFGQDKQAHGMGAGLDLHIAQTCFDGPVSKEKIQELLKRLWGGTHRQNGEVLWCGKYSIPFGLMTTMKTIGKVRVGKRLTGKVLRYSDTYTEGVIPLKKPGYGITAPFSFKHWVGFFSAAFY